MKLCHRFHKLMLVCFIMVVIKIPTYFIVFRSIKTGQSGFISGPSSAGKQSSSSSGRSFSPAGSRPKTSPTALNTSPHRNEHSPAAKSPLLGTAPPGLLPPPDKGQFKSESTLYMNMDGKNLGGGGGGESTS